MGTAKTPTPPRFKPATFTPLDTGSLEQVDLGQAQTLATDADRAAYAASDADFAARHPDLVAANKVNETNIAAGVGGALPPGYADALTKAGLGSALANFGSAGVGTGSTGEFSIAKNLGINYLDYAGQQRQALAQVNAATPERGIGLGGQGLLQLQLGNQNLVNQATIGNFQGANQVAIANTGNTNNANSANFATGIQAANAQGAQQAQYVQAAASLAGAFAGRR